jgi:hypothetical protein
MNGPKYVNDTIDKLFRQDTRESKLLAGRIIIAQQAQNTHLWKLMFMEARLNKWPWPDIDETEASWEAKRKWFELQEVFKVSPFWPWKWAPKASL